MRFSEFSFEFEEEEIFYHSLFHSPMIVAISEDCIHIGEVTEIQFYMSRELCLTIEDEWPDSLNDAIFERKLSILVYLSSRESYIFRGTISLKYIPHTHGDSTKVFHVVIFFFCKKLQACHLKYIHEILCHGFWVFYVFLPLTEMDVFVSEGIYGFDFCLGLHDFLYLYFFSLRFRILAKSDPRKRKRCHFII